MQKFTDMLNLGRMSDNLYGIQKRVIDQKEGNVDIKPFAPFTPKKFKK